MLNKQKEATTGKGSKGKGSKSKGSKRVCQWIPVILILSILLISAGIPVNARDSTFTQKGSGPKYWTTYEYQQQHNTYMDENEFKKNIDWLYDSGLAGKGYNMVVTDGWGRAYNRVNSYGYLTTHDDSWTNTYSYWVNYLSAKGMYLGVYANPLWMTHAVVSDPDSRTKYKVKGTNIPVLDLLVTVQDGFNCVDVTKQGAEQYIKGYVQHFIDIGAKYLRIDFLRNYENTMGAANYATALRWMSEAAGSSIELSLVMPNLYNHAENEVKYGDMVRIDDDALLQGWTHISAYERGTWQNAWSQYGNAFDGFVGFADKNDKGNLILDGDFIRLNAYDNDEERKFAVSLFAMAGSPLSFCDQYWSIGAGIFALQNDEINDLNTQGFAGKPFVFNINDPKSQCWKGQLPNGDWVVGLFNREDTAQTRSVNFAADLNMSGNGSVRDLWSHTNLGSMSSYSINLAAHSCKILKISGTTNDYTVKELEFGKMLGGAYTYVDTAGASNTNGVGYLGAAGSGVEVKKIAAGSQMTVRYASGQASNVTLSLYVNGSHNQDITFAPTGGWTGAGKYADKVVNVNIPAGATVKFQVDSGDGAVNLDKITIGTIASTWENLGGSLSDSLGISSQGGSSLDVFIRDSSGLKQRTWNGSSWGSWSSSLGGPTGDTFLGKPAAVSWANGRIDVFVRGTDNVVYHRWYTGGVWSTAWENMGGTTLDSPCVSSQADNKLDVLIRGSDNKLYIKSWTGAAWTAWTLVGGGGPTGGTFTNAPASVSWGDGRIDVFVRGTDGVPYHLWKTGGAWATTWENMGGYSADSPSAASKGLNKVGVYIRGGDNQLWLREFDGTSWSGWTACGGPSGGTFSGAPATVSRSGSNTVDIVVKGTDNVLYKLTR